MYVRRIEADQFLCQRQFHEIWFLLLSKQFTINSWSPGEGSPLGCSLYFLCYRFCDNLGPIICPLHTRWCCTLVTKLAVSHTVLATPYYWKHIMLLPGGQFSTRIAINALLSLFCSIVFGSSYRLFTINSLSPFLPQAWGEPAPLWNHGQNLKIPLHCF